MGLKSVGVFIRKKVWIEHIFEQNFFPYKCPNISQTYFILHTYLPMKMEQCSETSAYKIQTPRN